MHAPRIPGTFGLRGGFDRLVSLRGSLLWLGRDRAITTLLVLQVAAGFVLLCAACQTIAAWHARRVAEEGVVHAGISVLAPLLASTASAVQTRELLQELRAVRGVTHLAVANQVPHGDTAWTARAWTDRYDAHALPTSVYLGSEGLRALLGVPLRAGRDFAPHEYVDYGGDQGRLHPGAQPAIISRALARGLFGTEDVLGRRFQLHADAPLHVIGIADLPTPAASGDAAVDGRVVLLPVRMTLARHAQVLIRGAPRERDRIARDARMQLMRAFPGVPADAPTGLATLHARAGAAERAHALQVGIAAAVWWVWIVGTLAVTGLRWVQAHAVELSLRRAMGACPGHLAHALRREYLLVACAGIAAGATVWLSLQPARWLPSLAGEAPSWTVPACVLLIVFACGIASVPPARHLARVAPHHVSRSPSVRL